MKEPRKEKIRKGVLEKSGVTLAKLSALAKIVELGSASAYCKARGVGEPQVSRQLKELGAALGRQLFLKQGRNNVPTACARRIAGAFSQFISEVERVEKPSAKSGIVRIGVVESALRCLLALHLEKIEDAHPATKIEVHCRSSQEIADQVTAGELEFGMIEEDGCCAEGLVSRSLGTLKYFLCADHRLVERENYNERSILEQGRLIEVRSSQRCLEMLREILQNFEIPESYCFSCESFSDAASLLEEVRGAFYVAGIEPGPLQYLHYSELSTAEVLEAKAMSRGESIALVHRRKVSREVASVANTLMETCTVAAQIVKPGE